MPLPFRLRRARFPDLDGLLLIEKEVFRREPFTRSQMASLLRSKSSRTTLAVCQGEPAGFIAVAWRKGASTCRIVNLAVRRRYRGYGIGGALIRSALESGRRGRFRGVTLEVEVKNRRARFLYEQIGFGVDRRLPHYYEKGRHGLRYVCWFAARKGHPAENAGR
ncbi:MAG: GNAT family N-acetyltransferase [Acidobacteriota bacterium]